MNKNYRRMIETTLTELGVGHYEMQITKRGHIQVFFNTVAGGKALALLSGRDDDPRAIKNAAADLKRAARAADLTIAP